MHARRQVAEQQHALRTGGHGPARAADAVLRGGPPAVSAAGPCRARGEADPVGPSLDALVRLLDATAVAMLLYDGRGRSLRATAAVSRLLAEDDGAASVCELADAIVGERIASGWGGGARARAGDPVRRFAHTRHWTYRLVCGVLGAGVTGGVAGAATVAVVVERESRCGMTDDDLRARFGLSPREVEVARLVADGWSTPRVARALGISAHTARHHLERVFTKVGLSTRASLQALVRGSSPPLATGDRDAMGKPS